MEEEKKEHVKKAGEVLNWVSNVTKTFNQEGRQDISEKTPVSNLQISSDEILAKQDEISDALQTLQVVLAKHSDRMSEEEREEIEKQVKALQDSQSILSREYERQQQEAKDLVDRMVEQKVDKVISGTIDESTGIVQSLYQSIKQGLIDYETGILLLEVQLIVSGLVSPNLKKCFNIEEAKTHALIDEQMAVRLSELADAKSHIGSLSSTEFPIADALDQGLITENVAVKVIDTLLSCGCLCVHTSGEPLNLNKLLQRNLISTGFFSKISEKQKVSKDLIDPITAEKLTYVELFQRSAINRHTGMRFLNVSSQEKGKVLLKSGRRIHVLRAAHEGVLEREVMFRLLGAQIFSGGIIDPDAGNQLTLEEALERGIIDHATVCGILTQQVQNGGILCPSTGKYLTVDEAVQCNLISYSSALLVLEAQRGFIGMIWPDTSEIFPISTSLQQGMISNELAEKIISNRQKIAGLYIPETSEILSLDLAVQMSVIEHSTASILRNIQLSDKMPNIDQLEPTSQQALKWMSYESHSSPFNELNENKSLESDEGLTHDPEHTKQLFISYLMINSYIDANTGDRLLLYDGDLDEAASMLLESEDIVRATCATNAQIVNFTDNSDNTLSRPIPMCKMEYANDGQSLETAEMHYVYNVETGYGETTSCPSLKDIDLVNVSAEELHEKHSKKANSDEREYEDATEPLELDFEMPGSVIPNEEKQAEKENADTLQSEDSFSLENKQTEDIKQLTDYETPHIFSKLHSETSEDASAICNHMMMGESQCNTEVNINNVPDNSRDGSAKSDDHGLSLTDVNLISNTVPLDYQREASIIAFSSECDTEHLLYKDNTDIPEDLAKSDTEVQYENSSCDGCTTPTPLEHTPIKHYGSGVLYSNSDNQDSGLPQFTFDADDYRNSPLEYEESYSDELQSSSDYDMSDDSDNDFFGTCEPANIYEIKQAAGDVKFEGLVHASSDEDNFNNDNDAEDTDLQRARQFLETIIEEDSESNSCAEDQILLCNDQVQGQECISDTGAFEGERNNHEHISKDAVRNLLDEERTDELSESCFSETDIECFVTDETSNEDDCQFEELHTNEQNEDSKPDHCDDNAADLGNAVFELNYISNTNLESSGTSVNRFEVKDHTPSFVMNSPLTLEPIMTDSQDVEGDHNPSFVMNSPLTLEPIITDSQDVEGDRNPTFVMNLPLTLEPIITDSQDVEGDRNPSFVMNSPLTLEPIMTDSQDVGGDHNPSFVMNSPLTLEPIITDSQDVEGDRNPTFVMNSPLTLEPIITDSQDVEGDRNPSFVMNSPLTLEPIITDLQDVEGDRNPTFVMNSPLTLEPIITDSQDVAGEYRNKDPGLDCTQKSQSLVGESSDVPKPATQDPKTNGELQTEISSTKDHPGSACTFISENILPNVGNTLSETYVKDNIGEIPRVLNTNLQNDRNVQHTAHSTNVLGAKVCIPPEQNVYESKDVECKCVLSESVVEVNETETCKFVEKIEGTERIYDDNTSNSQPVIKSPIHIDSLSAIFNSSGSKQPNTNEPSTTTVLSGSQSASPILHSSPENAFGVGGLTSYLKGCAEDFQTTHQLTDYTLKDKHCDQAMETSVTSVECENPNLSMGSGTINNDQSPRENVVNPQLLNSTENLAMRHEDQRSEGKEFPIDLTMNSIASNGCSESINNDRPHLKNDDIETSENCENTIVQKSESSTINNISNKCSVSHMDTHAYSVKDYEHVKDSSSLTYEKLKGPGYESLPVGSDICHGDMRDLNKLKNAEKTAVDIQSSSEEHQVKIPNSPRLIPLQLEQIFHVPPDSENSNKFETLIINLNKGIFPTEIINYNSNGTKRETNEPLNNMISQDQVPLQTRQGSKYTSESTDEDQSPVNLKSVNDENTNQSEENHSKLSQQDENMGCQSSDMISITLRDSIQKLGEHLPVVQDMKFQLENLLPVSDNLDTLRSQFEQLKSFEAKLSAFSSLVKEDLKFVGKVLKSAPNDLLDDRLKELNDCLMKDLAGICETSSESSKQIVSAIDSEMSKLTEVHERLLSRILLLSDWIAENKDIISMNTDTDDVESIKQNLQYLNDKSRQLAEQKTELETTAFDIQFFISEHAQDLSPNQSKQLLRLLNTTQKSFYDALKITTAQTESMKSNLLEAQDLSNQKDAETQLQEHKVKLEEMGALLTQTENRLIGQRETFSVRDSPTELQHYQTEYEELQKDMQAGASELAEIVKNTEKFLHEHGDNLSKEDRALIEQKLKETKVKFDILRKKAEESKKELEKAVTTAIKKETEKSAAVEQLEESKTKIESLLEWLSNVDKDSDNGNSMKEAKIQRNGVQPKDGDLQSHLAGEEEVNGNLIESDGKGNILNGHDQAKGEDLNSQYKKIKAQHEKIVSQHQAVIIATQSAQALLEKQGRHLAPEEKEKLQKDIADLKMQYETTLFDSEQKMKVIQTVQEELEKFTADYTEFESWLHESKAELEHLESGAADFSGITEKLNRQKNFSEDVISHKGDLRYITISGQRVLDAAKSRNKDNITENNNNVSTLETCNIVQSKLDTAAENFKSLHSKCNILGNNLKDLVDKYQHYKESSAELLAGMQRTETAVNKRLSEPIAADTKNLQRQQEETKVLCEQVSSQQAGVEKLKKAAEVILETQGGLLLNKDEIQKPLDEIVAKHSNLSESLNEWNGRLQMTFTRSLSVQDGLNEMLNWMGGVEKDLKEQQQVPLNSSAIQDIISKNNMLEHDISNRQSSIYAMNEKVNKFIETADKSTASSLQTNMSELSQRFSKACENTKQRITLMEGLKTKVELFDKLSGDTQSFLDKKVQDFKDADGPGKDVAELSQYMQETRTQLSKHKQSLEELQRLVDDLCVHGVPGDKALAVEKLNTLLRKFRDLEDTVKAKEEDVSSCQSELDTFKALVQSLKHWFLSVNERIPASPPTLCVEELSKQLGESKNLLSEWTQKSPDVQKVTMKGTTLSNFITAVTSPAKTRATVKSSRNASNGNAPAGDKDHLTSKELAVVQKEMSDINNGYEYLGTLLKGKISDLEGRFSQMKQVQEESEALMKWLEEMQAAAEAWEAPTDSEAVRAQIEQHKIFAAEVQKNGSRVEVLKDNLKELLNTNPGAEESTKWEDTLDKIDSSWSEISRLTVERQQTLEESSNDLTLFQSAEAQLKQWLLEKELMASVLGPLSIDPNMLKTQKQQVQILLKEFDARKQQYEQLNTAGQKILSRPGDLPPCVEAVQDQLASVACKWESLTGQLNDRCRQIDSAIVKSTQYQDLLKGLSEKFSALNNRLNSNMTVSSHPDAVKEKLITAKEVQEDIKQEIKHIEHVKVICGELSDLVSETYLKDELNRQMETVVKPFKDLEQKAGFHVEQLQSAFTSSQKFHQMSEDFQSWIQKKKKEQHEAAPISAKLDTLMTLITEQTTFRKSLGDQLQDYENVVTEGENLLQKTEGEEKLKHQAHISTIKSDWEDLNKQALIREQSLIDCQQKAKKYKELVANIQPWIEESNNKLSEVKLSIDVTSIENSIGQVKLLQKYTDKQRGIVEMVNSAADNLINSCQADKEVIADEKDSLNKQVESLLDSLHNTKDSLETMSWRLKEYQESVEDSERQLTVTQEHLEMHNSLGAQAYSNKQLTIMQNQQSALQSLKPQVEQAKKLAQELVVDASDVEGVCDLLLQAEALQKKHSSISQEVDQKCSFLETKLQGIGHFQNSIREMFTQFAELDDELDGMPPVGRDQIMLQSQKQDMNTFLKKLGDLMTNNENSNKTCKMMLATESSPDLVGIKRDLEALNKQCNKLLDRAKSREEQIDSVIARTEEFYGTLKQFVDVLHTVEDHEESQGAVGMETDIINHQLNIFTGHMMSKAFGHV